MKILKLLDMFAVEINSLNKIIYQMKKTIVTVIAVVFIAASFVGCKKDFTCSCTYGSNAALNYDYKYVKVKKKDAQSSCDGLSSAAKIGGGSCTLK